MNEEVRTVEWEADEHYHVERGSDWYWILGILTIAGTVTSILLGNLLLGLLIVLSGFVVALVSLRPIRQISYAVTPRGVRIDDTLHPYSTIECFYIDEENYSQPILLVKLDRKLALLQVIPLPPESIIDIEEVLMDRIPEEHLEEPILIRALEFFGF